LAWRHWQQARKLRDLHNPDGDVNVPHLTAEKLLYSRECVIEGVALDPYLFCDSVQLYGRFVNSLHADNIDRAICTIPSPAFFGTKKAPIGQIDAGLGIFVSLLNA